jgi:hypothetical protein
MESSAQSRGAQDGGKQPHGGGQLYRPSVDITIPDRIVLRGQFNPDCVNLMAHPTPVTALQVAPATESLVNEK